MGLTITCEKISSPLKNPYHLSFATINVFNSVFVKIMKDNEIVGIGESTALPGYSSETQDDIYQWCKNYINRVEGIDAQGIKQELSSLNVAEFGFRSVPLSTAFESYKLYEEIFHTDTFAVPIIGLIKDIEKDSIREQIDMDSYSNAVYKIKVGTDFQQDAERINFISDITAKNVRLRIDANQGYTLDEAIKFTERINPEKLMFVEQPLAIEAWDNMAQLNAMFPEIAFMLDESIHHEDDILKSAKLNCCDYIKLKLFKCGSIQQTIKLAQCAHKSNLKVILGNGVQHIIGALYEAYIYHELNDMGIPMTETELIGPLKLQAIPDSLVYHNGTDLTFFPGNILDYENNRS